MQRFASPTALYGLFDDFVTRYNEERPRQALDMRVPSELDTRSERTYEGLGDLEYPFHDWTATVTWCGRDLGLVFAQAWEHQSSKHAELGGPLNMMTVNKQLDRLCKVAGVKRLTVHGLRHTCATLLLAAGVPPHVVQRRLGHKNISITLVRLCHITGFPNESASDRN